MGVPRDSECQTRNQLCIADGGMIFPGSRVPGKKIDDNGWIVVCTGGNGFFKKAVKSAGLFACDQQSGDPVHDYSRGLGFSHYGIILLDAASARYRNDIRIGFKPNPGG